MTIHIDRGPISYIRRTREWYQGLGYGEPYQWAHYETVPFTPLSKAISQSTVGLVTTAARFHPEHGDQGPAANYNAKAKFYRVYREPISPTPDVRISHIAYDRIHTSAKDINTWFPLKALLELQAQGVIGQVAEHFLGLPTNRSQRHTLEVDCPTLLSHFTGVDLALLVANCPVCHQSVSLAARHLENAGIPTVVMGCARDIVENVGVPRFLFSDFPLGNAAGKPFDSDSQDQTIAMAIKLFEKAVAPRSTEQSPLEWDNSHRWKMDYSNIAQLTPQQIAEKREEFHRQKEIAKSIRQKQ
ncbi:MAG: hypothetical protein KTR18_06285 [Acidiferrobacterales bacterium]|nr:hypothetical protein [Acidiferrobacterales bacterium]